MWSTGTNIIERCQNFSSDSVASQNCFQTSIPVTAPSAGIIEEFFVNDGDKVEKGQQLFKLVLTGMIIILLLDNCNPAHNHGCKVSFFSKKIIFDLPVYQQIVHFPITTGKIYINSL